MILRALAGVLLLTGCSLAPSDKVMEQFGKSERSWCVSVTSVYGTVRMGGTGIQGGSMVCTQEGMNVKDDAAKLIVPIQIVPAITIGPPIPTPPIAQPTPNPAPSPSR